MQKKALRLDVPSHITILNQSDRIISVLRIYKMLKFVLRHWMQVCFGTCQDRIDGLGPGGCHGHRRLSDFSTSIFGICFFDEIRPNSTSPSRMCVPYHNGGSICVFNIEISPANGRNKLAETPLTKTSN